METTSRVGAPAATFFSSLLSPLSQDQSGGSKKKNEAIRAEILPYDDPYSLWLKMKERTKTKGRFDGRRCAPRTSSFYGDPECISYREFSSRFSSTPHDRLFIVCVCVHRKVFIEQKGNKILKKCRHHSAPRWGIP